jgi:hypothetical protein
MKFRILAAAVALCAVMAGIAPAKQQDAPDDPLANVEITDNSTPDAFDIRIQAPASASTSRGFALGGLLQFLASQALAKPGALKGGKGHGPVVVPPPPPVISGILLSSHSFEGGAADGTVVGAISVQMATGSFSGSLSLAGDDADKFAVSGSNLVLNGTQPAGVYSVSVIATQNGASGSPFTSVQPITGSLTIALTGITLSNASFVGSSADGTVVGTISVQTTGPPFTGSLSLSGADADKFAISGSNLILNGTQGAGIYQVTVVATQVGASGSPLLSGKTITGTTSLTGVTLSNNSFLGDAADGTVVGSITVQTTGGLFSGALSLTGADAAKFKLVGTDLALNGTQSAGSYSINIVATQAGAAGSPVSDPETITGSVTTTLTGVTLSNSSFQGGSADGTVVGAISVQTTGGLFAGTLSLSGTDAAKFAISGNSLVLNGAQSAGTYSLNIVATQAGAAASPLASAKTITGTTVIAITGVSLSNSSFVGSSADGTVVGAISVQTTGGLFTGSLSLSGTDASKFRLSGNNLVLNGVQPAGTYALNVVATQAGATASPFSSSKTITGSTPLAITGITLSGNTFAAGAVDGTVVGAIGVQTTGGTFAGSLSLSGADAARFKIVGSNLALNGTQAAGSYALNIVATQTGALGSPFTSAKAITGGTTITGVTLAGGTFTAGAADGTTVGTISVQTVGAAFAGTLSLTGTDAARFKISGNALQLNGSQAAGTYALNIIAAASGDIATPFIKPVVITGFPAPVVVDATNQIFVTDKSGSTQTNYPMQFGRPFVCGEIAHYPQVIINGTPATTQADVKNRCTDGSAKFAVIAVMIPSIAANATVTLTFQDQLSGNNTALSTGDMLDASYDFNATIAISNSSVGGNGSVSARTMLSAGKCSAWTSGQIAQTMICADRSTSRIYDMGSSAWHSLHPEFIATFWPATHQVFVRYVGEVSNSMALEAFTADLTLTSGLASPTTVYQQTGVQHPDGVHWTRTAWVGGTPEPKINIKHNIGYLAATKMIPNYDASLVVIDPDYYPRWQTANKSIGGEGFWRLAMGDVGYHPEIGVMPVWYMEYLYRGDYRDREIMLGQADLFGSFGWHIREGDPARYIDRAHTVSALGRTISVYTRPSYWFGPRDSANSDSLIFRGPNIDNGWAMDDAHQPDPYTVPYMVTGDPYYLESLQLLTGTDTVILNPGLAPWARGGPYAVIYGQVRAEGWLFRTRANAWAFTPDSDPMKTHSEICSTTLWRSGRGNDTSPARSTPPTRHTKTLCFGPARTTTGGMG